MIAKEKWVEIMKEYEESGETKKIFCERRSIKRDALDYRLKLIREDLKSKVNEPIFQRIELKSEGDYKKESYAQIITITCRNGIKLEIESERIGQVVKEVSQI